MKLRWHPDFTSTYRWIVAALSRIYLAELLEGNRQEIVKYLCNDEDAWNWEPYYEFQVCRLIFLGEC